MTAETWLTQKQAAELIDVHVDTIRRHREKGTLGDCRQHPVTNAWLVPLSGLVAAGLYEPTDEDPREVLDAGRVTRDLARATTALEVERARAEQLELRLLEMSRHNDELTKLMGRFGVQGRAA